MTQLFVSLGARNRIYFEKVANSSFATNDPRRPSDLRSVVSLQDDWQAPDVAKLLDHVPRVPHDQATALVHRLFDALDDGWSRGEPADRYGHKSTVYLT